MRRTSDFNIKSNLFTSRFAWRANPRKLNLDLPLVQPSAKALETRLSRHRRLSLSFQDLILTLHRYWGAKDCVILQPYDMEMGAGTFHPATVLRALGPHGW